MGSKVGLEKGRRQAQNVQVAWKGIERSYISAPLTKAASYHRPTPAPRNPTITSHGGFALIGTDRDIIVAHASPPPPTTGYITVIPT